MSRRSRIIVFFFGVAGFLWLFFAAFIHLPGPAQLSNRYLVAINTRAFPERNTTDAVSAVNFDYRLFDTLGEEFILFASVMGSLVLLRQAKEKHHKLLPDAITPARDVPSGDAVRLWILVMIAPKFLFGIYVVTHGQLSPGGGFQGGVILASVALIIYLGEDFRVFVRIMKHWMIEACEALGAASLILIGLVALCLGKPFLTNFLPLGKSHELTSAGTIPLISIATSLEVAAGFVLLLYGFLQETLCQNEGE